MKLLILSTARSDYYLLRPLIKKIQKSKKLIGELVVTGSHLQKSHGYTYKEILNDKIKIYKKIKLNSSDKKMSINNSISIMINKFGKIIEQYKPKGVIILGDRYEALGCGIASFIFRVPVIHINGGELTHGAIDDTIRHILTKISTYHFASHKKYMKRIVQMGETPKNVFVVGHLGLENIKNSSTKNKKEIEKILKIKFLKKNLLVSFHPETRAKDFGISYFKNLLKVLKECTNTFIIFTRPNADYGNKKIHLMIKKFVKNNKNTKYVYNLGEKLYFSVVKLCDGVIGNSSSGVIEIPSLNITTLNIGQRQDGRIKADSVIDCLQPTENNLKRSVNKILRKKIGKNSYKKNIKFKNYETSTKIMKIIEKINLDKIEKKFFDLGFKY